ncbi:MAG: hypothetical protein H6807_10860 [Planctomycetes bacterium]|nr:hypothetical protein [Planctomycetota bacterium]
MPDTELDRTLERVATAGPEDPTLAEDLRLLAEACGEDARFAQRAARTLLCLKLLDGGMDQAPARAPVFRRPNRLRLRAASLAASLLVGVLLGLALGRGHDAETPAPAPSGNRGATGTLVFELGRRPAEFPATRADELEFSPHRYEHGLLHGKVVTIETRSR